MGDEIKGEFGRQTGFSGDLLRDIGVTLIERSRVAAKASDHHRYHVGSAILSVPKRGSGIIRENANKIPDSMKAAGYTTQHKFGEGHPTVHGEFPLLYQAPQSEHLFLGCNTPFCGACMKSSIVRGVDALFVDADSLATENTWTADFSEYWNELCLPIAEAAQLPIFSIDTNSGTLNTIIHGKPPNDRPEPDVPARILVGAELGEWRHNPGLFLARARDTRAVIGIARNRTTGKEHYIFAEDSYPPGFQNGQGTWMEEHFKDGHYRFPIDPIIHMCMMAARNNLELQDGRVLANFVPSSGRQLDLAHVGISHLMLTETHEEPTDESLTAMRELSRLGIIEYTEIKPNKELIRVLEQPDLGRGLTRRSQYLPD